MKTIAKLFSADIDGINAYLIEVEADINVGLHSFNIVGLADKAVSEAKERVNSALKNCEIKPPSKENRRVTINLAPADIKKSGSKFDLPIALTYLLASEQITPFDYSDKLFIGELSLDGALRPVDGVLNIALFAKQKGIRYLYVPKLNAVEAAAVSGIEVVPVETLRNIVEHLEGIRCIVPQPLTQITASEQLPFVSLSEIKGLPVAKRALLIAAAGNHHILLSGPPGTGKTMLAQALASILPQPSFEECIEITRIYSSAGLNKESPFINYRPFRAPHHSASFTSIVGGGTYPKPGEISLAHRGVLFLDETPEFRRDVLEGLRQPLEGGEICVARARKSLIFPARFMLVLSMNPCPCGYYGDPQKECNCTANTVFRYQKKISGPLMDRIDIQLEVPRVSIETLRNSSYVENEDEVYREKVAKARKIQKDRMEKIKVNSYTNSELKSKDIDSLIHLDSEAEEVLKNALEKSFISTRGYYRTLRIAQTIADLEESPIIKRDNLAEAFQYRLKNNE